MLEKGLGCECALCDWILASPQGSAGPVVQMGMPARKQPLDLWSVTSAPQPRWPLCWPLNMPGFFPPLGLCLCCPPAWGRATVPTACPSGSCLSSPSLGSAAVASVGPALAAPPESPPPPVRVLTRQWLYCHQSVGHCLKLSPGLLLSLCTHPARNR